MGSTRIPSPFVVVHNVKGKASAVDHLPEIGPTMVEDVGIWWNTECSKSHRNDALQRWGEYPDPAETPSSHTPPAALPVFSSGCFLLLTIFSMAHPPPPWPPRNSCFEVSTATFDVCNPEPLRNLHFDLRAHPFFFAISWAQICLGLETSPLIQLELVCYFTKYTIFWLTRHLI